MLQILKKKSLKASLLLLVVLLAISLAMLYFTGFGIFKLIGGGKLLDELPIDSINGKYVSYNVDYILDYYAETTQTSDSNPVPKVVSCEYIIPVGYEGGLYMGLVAPKSYIGDFDDLLDASIAYLNGGDAPEQSYAITGTVLPMDKESLKFYHEVVGYDSGDAEFQSMFLPYYLKIDQLGTMEYGGTIALSVLSAVSLLCAVFTLIRVLCGNYQSEIKKYCKSQPDADYALERLDNWYSSAEELSGGIRIGDQWTVFQQGRHSRLLSTSDIVWAYQSTTKHRTNGIPTGTSYSLVLRCRTGKQLYTVPMRSESDVRLTLDYIELHFPNIILGYSDWLNNTFIQNPAGFTAAVEAAAEAAASTTE